MLSPRTYLPRTYLPRTFLAQWAHSKSSKSSNSGPPLYSTGAPKPLPLSYEKFPTDASTSKGPLLILHGFLGSKQNWRTMARALSSRTGRDVWALDIRNHGSSPHRRGMQYSEMTRDVRYFIQHEDLKDVCIMGHSMGGKVAMSLALSADSAVPHSPIKDLIVVDIAPTVGPISPEFERYLVAMANIESRIIRSRREADDIMKEFVPSFTIREFLLTNLLPITPKSPKRTWRVPLDLLRDSLDDIGDFPFKPGEKEWTGRTLALKGTKSNYINGQNIEVAKKFFPNLQLQEIDAGHWVHYERPAEFLDAVTEFLKGS